MKKVLSLCVALGALLACGGANEMSSMMAAPGDAVQGTVEATPLNLQCNGSTLVKVTLVGGSSVSGRPVDIMLVLDRSGSMEQEMGALKNAAKAFVDMLDDATDGTHDGVISYGNRIGVVSFSSSATLDRPLTSNATLAKAAIDGLSAGGSTNHAAGITTAQSQLGPSPNADIMIIFTDGNTTAGPDPRYAAAAARAAGTEIYGIGLGDGLDRDAIRSWVSGPVDRHAYFTTDPGTLRQVFEEIGAGIIAPAATGARLTLAVNGNLAASTASVSKGSVTLSQNNLVWTIGTLLNETVTLTYVASHDNLTPGGPTALHTAATYSDNEHNAVTLDNPVLNVHGCAKTLDLTPEVDTNIVGDPHTVTATVRDDYGAPVGSVSVAFSVAGGPSMVDGEPSAPSPSTGSGITNNNGQVTFTYTNIQASQDIIIARAPVQPNVSSPLVDTARKTWYPLPVVIDIKPGSDPSSFGANSLGQIPVAVFGSATFNVARIDDSTVRFGDAPSALGDAADSHGRGHIEQINGDGIPDKVYHFYFPDTHLDPTDTEGCLSGEMDGRDFMGCSDVNIVPRLRSRR